MTTPPTPSYHHPASQRSLYLPFVGVFFFGQVLFASLRISQRKFYDTKPFCAVFMVSWLFRWGDAVLRSRYCSSKDMVCGVLSPRSCYFSECRP